MTTGNGADKAMEGMLAQAQRLDQALEQAQSPMGTLAAAYNCAPHPMIRDFINSKALELLMTEMPRLQSIILDGPVEEAANMPSIGKAFDEAMQRGAPEGMTNEDVGLTPDVIELGQSFANSIDAAVAELTADEEYILRLPVYELIAAHAKLVKGLAEIRLSDEQKAVIAEKKAAAKAAEASNDETISEPTV